MKPFNLEEYLANPSRKVITRDGRNVRIICTDAKVALVKEEYPIVALVEMVKKDKDGEFILSYLKDGRFAKDITSDLDLFFAPEKHEGWVNLYREYLGDIYYTGRVHEFEKDAKDAASERVIATAKIEWEE